MTEAFHNPDYAEEKKRSLLSRVIFINSFESHRDESLRAASTELVGFKCQSVTFIHVTLFHRYMWMDTIFMNGTYYMLFRVLFQLASKNSFYYCKQFYRDYTNTMT